MSKRLTDTLKWSDPWFMDLPSKYKLFWFYILDNCDHAGIWKVNFKVASFYIGEHLEPSEVRRFLSGRITSIENDLYWQVNKFIDFQYGGIKTDSVGKSIVKILQKHNIYEGLSSPYEGTMVKDKDKVKDMVKVKDEEQVSKIEIVGSSSDKNFIVIDAKYVSDKIYKIHGVEGLRKYLEEISISKLTYPEFAKKFMVEKDGCHFTDLKHLNNAYRDFVDKIYKQ